MSTQRSLPETEEIWVARERYHRFLREKMALTEGQLMYRLRDWYVDQCSPLDARTRLP